MSEPSRSHVSEAHEPGTSDTALPNAAAWEKLDALLKDLPPGIPLLPPEDAGNFEKYTHRPRHAFVPGDGWKNCARALEKYDAELCKGYREEIDTLLVFAGLFSAVVTAFTIESYQWLQADPNDAMIVLLTQIAQSVSLNNTVAPPVPAAAGLPGSVSVRINVYWFLALALSLSAALVAILCKQWIREFERNIALSPKQFIRVHQTKLEGLEKGRVGGIISLLPLLLQLALALFALGVLELLWQLHSAIAAVVCVPTVVAFVFYAATTVLPSVTYYAAVSYDCPYKSPQAMLAFPAYGFWTWTRGTVTAGLSYLRSLIKHYITVLLCAQSDVLFPVFDEDAVIWLGFYVPKWHVLSRYINFGPDNRDPLQPLSVYRSFRWMHLNLDDGDVTQWIWHCLWEMALAPDPYAPGDEGAIQRGFHHVELGRADVPQAGLRALALAYLMQTSSPSSFIVEAFIQNLSSMDAASAEYLTNRMRRYSSPQLDAESVVSILKAVGAYGRSHIQEPIGGFLVNAARLCFSLPSPDPQLRRVFLAYTTVLYHAWICIQPVPHQPSTVKSNEAIVLYNVHFLRNDPEQYQAHPERLHLRPGVQELAELLSIYAQSHDDPAAALGATISPEFVEEIRPIFQALLEMARPGEDSAAAAGNGALVLEAAASPALPHADPPPGPPSSRVQSPARMTEGDPSRTPSPRHYSARSTQSRAPSLEPPPSRLPELEESVETEEDRHGISGSSGLHDNPTLRADAAHEPPDRRVQRRPSGNNADAVHCADGEGDREAGGSTGGTDAALSQGAGGESESAPDDSGLHGSVSLRAVIIHSPSDAGAHPAVRQGAERDPGEDQESRRDDRGADASVLPM